MRSINDEDKSTFWLSFTLFNGKGMNGKNGGDCDDQIGTEIYWCVPEFRILVIFFF
jgi:hypothetical protein